MRGNQSRCSIWGDPLEFHAAAIDVGHCFVSPPPFTSRRPCRHISIHGTMKYYSANYVQSNSTVEDRVQDLILQRYQLKELIEF